MIKNIFIFSIIIFMYSCSSTEYSPDDQLRFNSTWENFLSKTKSANTEARKTHWSQKANAHLDQKLSFSNWYGKIIKVGSDYITVKSNGIKYYLYPQGSKVNYIDFDKGMKLLFSGKLNGNYWLDSVAKPGLYVNCTSITNVENNYTYFEMTKQELLAIEKKKQEEESKRKREQRIKEGYCLLPGCSNKGQGWKYYNTSQGSAFGMDFIGCVRKYSTGGCCSKSHCAEYEANY